MATPDAVTAAGQRGPRAVRHDLAPRLRQHPEVWPALGVAAAWAALLALALRGGQGGGMAGMDMGSHVAGAGAGAGHAARASVWGQAGAGLPSWLLMTIAMMGPAALPRIGHVGRASAHRLRDMAGFAVAYLAIWAAFGLAVQASAAVIPGVPGSPALAIALIIAVAWQLSPPKRTLLRACHRTAIRGAADGRGPGQVSLRAALRQGVRYGLCCLGACWCLMLAMVAVPAGQLYWLAGLTVLSTAERVVANSRDATRNAAAALGVAAVATLAVGGLL